MARQYSIFRKRERIHNNRNKVNIDAKILTYFDFDLNKPVIITNIIFDNTTLSWKINNIIQKRQTVKNIDKLIDFLHVIKDQVNDLKI